ncbi:MAG: biotin carboxylase [Solirubrobacterales bacterium]|nr:biotin carboxylase [Solirubrobacterales bacterium]
MCAVLNGMKGVCHSPLTGFVEEIVIAEGENVVEGATVLLVEAMKMHHEVTAPSAGVVRGLSVGKGDQVEEGQQLFEIEAGGAQAVTAGIPDTGAGESAGADLLADVLARRAKLEDEARPDAVAKRRALGRRTARENITDLCDTGTFSEYGGLAIAAQRLRRPVEELIDKTPADGMVCGVGTVNAELFGVEAAQCALLSYDYTVLAGTQGVRNHRKTDRILDIAQRQLLPVILFAEGGGGRPGDTDQSELFHLVVPTFRNFAKLSGLVPRVGVVSGRCFAGNASLLGCCDVIIATPDATIGMGGPAMIEGGGLGTFTPEQVGPVKDLANAGVIDLLVADEAAAVDAARRFIGYFQGPVSDWSAPDQTELRSIVPDDSKRVHDARAVLNGLFDTDSVMELRPAFGRAMITAFARIEGKPVGVIANDPSHLSGAIDAEASDKAARFIQLCDAFGIPIISLVDTPGFMVGPDSELTGMVRRSSRLFTAAASISVPFVSVVVRRAFGLGAQAMTGGDFHAPTINLAWPSAEFGAMGVEGAVRLGFQRELAAIEDESAREQRVAELVEAVRAQSNALNMATFFEIDDVIDPATTRARLISALNAATPVESPLSTGIRRRTVDTW